MKKIKTDKIIARPRGENSRLLSKGIFAKTVVAFGKFECGEDNQLWLPVILGYSKTECCLLECFDETLSLLCPRPSETSPRNSSMLKPIVSNRDRPVPAYDDCKITRQTLYFGFVARSLKISGKGAVFAELAV